MYWKLSEMRREPSEGAPPVGEKRFVLHRHVDADGPHLDLRLEAGNCLLGWRIAGEELNPGCWASEKAPHPKSWLDEDRDAQRELAGAFNWHCLEPGMRTLTLHTAEEKLLLRFERCAEASAEQVRALAEWAREHELSLDAMTRLAEDGLTARRQAIARFCALSRELDGQGFDEPGWRALLERMGLDGIGERLAAVEIRCDRMRPPEPVSRAEPLDLPGETPAQRARRAMRILEA